MLHATTLSFLSFSLDHLLPSALINEHFLIQVDILKGFSVVLLMFALNLLIDLDIPL